MGYTELGRKRPIEINGDFFTRILVYQYKGETWGICYKGDDIDGVYNYTLNDFFWSDFFGMSLKEIVKKIIQPLKRSFPGAYVMVDEEIVIKALKVKNYDK